MSALWQQWRGEAYLGLMHHLRMKVIEHHNLAVAALERSTASLDLQNEAQKAALYGLLGSFGMDIFANYEATTNDDNNYE